MSAAQIQPVPARSGLTDAATTVVEARAHARVALDLPIEIHSSDFAGPLDARARDISLGGICAATTYTFAFRNVHHVALKLPQGPLTLAVDGRWQADSPSESSFLTGIAFVNTRPEVETTLWGLVHGAGQSVGLFLYENSDLAALGTDASMSVAQISRLRMVASGRSVLCQGEQGPGNDSIFVVQRGRVEILYRYGAQDEVRVAGLGPGSVFGGLPIVAEQPNLMSAVAVEECRLLEISRPAYSYLRLAKPLVAQRLAQIVSSCHFERVRRLLEASGRGRRNG